MEFSVLFNNTKIVVSSKDFAVCVCSCLKVYNCNTHREWRVAHGEGSSYYFSDDCLVLLLLCSKISARFRVGTISDSCYSSFMSLDGVANVNIVAKAIFHPFNFDTNIKQIQTVTYSTATHYPLFRFIVTFYIYVCSLFCVVSQKLVYRQRVSLAPCPLHVK